MIRNIGKFALLFVLWAAAAGAALATQVMLQDGRILKGKLGRVSGMNEVPKPVQADGAGPLQLIVFLDDDLRRTFFPQRQVREVSQDAAGEVVEKFMIRQRTLEGGRTVKSIGAILRITPFDEYGRRTFTMNTPQGRTDIVQGITEITPEWTRVQGITHAWDMRMATSSIPQDALSAILARLKPDPNDEKRIDQRKKIAHFYIQCERYEAAVKVLEAMQAEFPTDTKLKEDLAVPIQAIKQRAAKRLLAELEARSKAGQHRLVLDKLKTFPADGASGETLQAVREMAQQYESQVKARETVLQQIDQLIEKITDKGLRKRLVPIRKELGEELSLNTLERMAAFRELAGDASLQPGDKVALAITGWILGTKSATTQLSTGIALYDLRAMVRRYLATADKLGRAKLFEDLQSAGSGATVEQVAQLIAHMKPAVETPPPENEGESYTLEVPGLGQAPAVRYLVQLPPEYDPYRRYPAVVTLHGAGTAPEYQVDWWAGKLTEGGWRAGQASRQGYIVIAPDWTTEHQKQYGYSAREHAAVLDTLRDACRRFSIDTDRVFLSGHSMGGDAAWDLGLAHPDLWAGVVPIVAQSDRYCAFYADNAKLVPFYFVAGELDGGRMNKNARDLDRYMAERGYNCTVVEYLGRGHEYFSDEILRIFDWMSRFRRNFFPREFKSASMRPWDNFFWWIELKQLPARSMVDPADWPPSNNTRAVKTEASVTKKDGIYIATGAGQATIWLSPELLDIDRRINVVVNGRRISSAKPLTPDLGTLLEDVRTRGDRQHPFWIKVESSTGRLVTER